MRVKLLSTLRIGMALFLAVFANGMLPMLAQTALANDGQTGTLQPVWCQKTGNHWSVNPGTGDNDQRYPLMGSFSDENGVVTEDNADLYTTAKVGQTLWDSADLKNNAILNEGCETQYVDTIVTPLEPTIKADECGTAGDIFTIPSVIGVIYKINDVTITAGDHPTNGATSVTITAEAASGYTLEGNNTPWTLNFNVDQCIQQIPIPDKPEVIDPCDSGNSMWSTPANTNQVTWTVTDGNLIASTTTGYEFTDGTTAHNYGQATETNTSDCIKIIDIPTAPNTNDPCGLDNATWTLPADTDSLDWSLSNEGILSVQAKAGYEFSDGETQKSFGLAADSDELCLAVVTEPVKHDVCTPEEGTNDTFTLANTTGVTYYVDGVLTPAGTHPASSKLPIVITAVADSGYELSGYPIDGWVLEFTNKSCKVTICHATDSNTNPYERITIDSSAIDEENNTDLNGHGDHTGPVWNPELKKQGKDWGDIIPEFTNDAGVTFPGYNWENNPEGQAIWENGCEFTNIVKPTVTIQSLQECVPIAQSNGSILVTIHNDNDIAMTYQLNVGSQSQTVSVPANSDESITLSGYAAGTYTVKVYEIVEPTVLSVDLGALKEAPKEVFSDSVTLAECPPEEVTPSVVVVIDECGTENDRHELPANSTKVTYSATRDGLTLVITATPNTGYALSSELGEGWTAEEDGTAIWTYTFTNTSCGAILGDTDICPNLAGSQATIPAGYTKNANGDCIKQVAGISDIKPAVATPQVLPATGSEASMSLVGFALAILTYIVMLRRQPVYEV